MFLPAINVVWWEEINSEETLAILSAKILVSSLYIKLTREIGLKAANSVVVGILRIRFLKVWLDDFSSGLPLKKWLTQVNIICFSPGHSALKKPTVKPSGPGD